MSIKTKLYGFRDEFKQSAVELSAKVGQFKDDHNLGLSEDGSLSAGSIIGFAIGLIVIAAVIPSAIATFYSTNTTTWLINGQEDAKTTTLWWLLPFIAVAVVLYMLYKRLE